MPMRLLCATPALLAIVGATVPASAGRERAARAAPAPVVRHATGTFDVAVQRETDARYRMTKTFAGAVTGGSEGTMVADGVVEAYAAVERFSGRVDGREGAFVLLHRGYRSPALGMNLDVVIAPNSGSGALAGISGRLSIKIRDGKHFYDLEYTIPSR